MKSRIFGIFAMAMVMMLAGNSAQAATHIVEFDKNFPISFESSSFSLPARQDISISFKCAAGYVDGDGEAEQISVKIMYEAFPFDIYESGYKFTCKKNVYITHTWNNPVPKSGTYHLTFNKLQDGVYVHGVGSASKV